MFRKCVIALFLVTVATQSAFSQSTFGTVVGVVRDPDQLVVPGAQVSLTNLDDNSRRVTSVDSEGAFQFTNVRADDTSLS